MIATGLLDKDAGAENKGKLHGLGVLFQVTVDSQECKHTTHLVGCLLDPDNEEIRIIT